VEGQNDARTFHDVQYAHDRCARLVCTTGSATCLHTRLRSVCARSAPRTKLRETRHRYTKRLDTASPRARTPRKLRGEPRRVAGLRRCHRGSNRPETAVSEQSGRFAADLPIQSRGFASRGSSCSRGRAFGPRRRHSLSRKIAASIEECFVGANTNRLHQIRLRDHRAVQIERTRCIERCASVRSRCACERFTVLSRRAHQQETLSAA
jgi:hypothetical protein